jgi:predicted GNAT family acetyltransferase
VTDDSTTTEVRNNRDRSRYEIVVDGSVGGFLQYTMRGGRVLLTHTEIPDAASGKGLATTLVREALGDLRQRGLGIVPVCPFVERFIERNPDYDDLVDHEMFTALNAEARQKN